MKEDIRWDTFSDTNIVSFIDSLHCSMLKPNVSNLKSKNKKIDEYM